MLERIRFRWLLPLVMTLVQLILFAVTAAHERAAVQRSALSIPVVQAAVLQEEGGTVSFEPITSPPPSLCDKIAAILNLPAMFGGAVLATVLGRETDASIMGFSVLFVPFVWWPIGSWVDQQVAGIGVVRKGIARRTARWMLRAVALLALIAAVFLSHDGWEGQQDYSYIPVGIWTACYLICSFRGERRLTSLQLGDIIQSGQQD
ncbi:hypothetical protein [Occallatibacter riparius]|uniref:Uncharacterized protein n=1 Tax=Occallatibacter riparius TaxID=1002689 RepID=A0A9J7BKS6_9BACT|nr:hypothetical protein [Occallatibacter riparius]UWZ83432.1 hypothetical protein MOP44_23050 [Occallatibacter riparius]